MGKNDDSQDELLPYGEKIQKIGGKNTMSSKNKGRSAVAPAPQKVIEVPVGASQNDFEAITNAINHLNVDDIKIEQVDVHPASEIIPSDIRTVKYVFEGESGKYLKRLSDMVLTEVNGWAKHLAHVQIWREKGKIVAGKIVASFSTIDTFNELDSQYDDLVRGQLHAKLDLSLRIVRGNFFEDALD